MKLRACGVSIAFLLVAMLGSMGITDVNESNIEEYIQSDCVSVADFIEDNFDKFVVEYNAASGDSWDASTVEDRFPITVDECGTTYDGVFMDFDGENGYAVVGNDYELLDFQTSGESPYKNVEADGYYYSATTGYHYLSGEEYLSVNEDNNADESVIIENANTSSMKHYEGQQRNAKGCGKIENTDAYVKSKYGSGWRLDRHRSLPMQGYTQGELSCYEHNYLQNGHIYHSTEGNCWVVSAFHVMQYLADTRWKYTYVPKSTSRVTYDPSVSEPAIYLKYFYPHKENRTKFIHSSDRTEFAFEYALRKNLNFPELYTVMREHVSERYGQINDGGNDFETAEIMESTAKRYNRYLDADVHIFWSFYVDKGTQQIDQNRPLVWSTSRNTYEEHSMAVCGYKYYSKVTGWWIFKSTKYKLFYELRDGHTAEPRFFDMSGYTGASALTFINC